MNATTNTLFAHLVAAHNLKALTHCCDCGRDLSDAASVELGIGPICRKRAGYKDAMDAVVEHLRPLANAAIKAISMLQQGEEILPQLDVLRTLGFDKLAARVEERVAKIQIQYDGERILVSHPANDMAFRAFYFVPGRTNPKSRGWKHAVPVSSQGHITRLLASYFPGELGFNNLRGLFRVGAPDAASWTVHQAIDAATLEAMAARLATSSNETCQATAAAVGVLASGEAARPDWRPTETIPEDQYAL